MDPANHLARVLPEMARAARNSALTVDALYSLLAGLRSTLPAGEAADQLRLALQHLEQLKRGVPAEESQALFAIVEDACARVGSFLASESADASPAATPASPRKASASEKRRTR